MFNQMVVSLGILFSVQLTGYGCISEEQPEFGEDGIDLSGGHFKKIKHVKKPGFEEMISGLEAVKESAAKLDILNKALEEWPDSRPLYFDRLIPLISGLDQEVGVTIDLFKDATHHLSERIKLPLTKEEAELLIKNLTLSNRGRILVASHFWSIDLKDLSFDVAFNQEDKKRFQTHDDKIKAAVVKAEENPFREHNDMLWHEMSKHELWPALVNYWMCFDETDDRTQYTGIRPAIVGMMTVFGEQEVRSWVTDLDRRKRWLENPIIIAGYFYQQGMTNEAFKYLEDAGLRKNDSYLMMCYYSGSYDKAVTYYQDLLEEGKELDFLGHYKLAFAAQQSGDRKLYEIHLNIFFDSVETEDQSKRKQVQLCLAVGEMEKALQIANRYHFTDDVFKLLCLGYKNELAHQYIQLGKVIDPEGIKPAAIEAKNYFTQLNHRFAKTYDPDWEMRSLSKKYISPAEQIKLAMKQGEKITPEHLSEFNFSKEDKELEVAIVEYLMKGHFGGSLVERRLLEKHNKTKFLSEHFLAAWNKRQFYTGNLFLAGYYAKFSGRKELGSKWMRIAFVTCYGNDGCAQDLINVIKSVDPDHENLPALRKISRRSVLCFPDGRQCYQDAYDRKEFQDAARLWVSDHFITLGNRGSSYGKLWWAWHNNAHDDEALGQREIELGNLEKAYQHLLNVRKVSENRYQLGKNLYHAYLKKGDKARADEIYQSHWQKMKGIYEENPHFHWALSLLVRWSLECRNPMDGRALDYARKLSEMRGDRYFESRLLAEHYVLNNQPNEARETLEIWTERRPRDQELADFVKDLKLPMRNQLDDGEYFGHQGWF